MITELLTTLGEDYRETDGGGLGRFASIYVLQSRAGYRIAHILTEDVLQEATSSQAFLEALSSPFPNNVAGPEKTGMLSRGIYWLSANIPYQPQSVLSQLTTTGLLSATEIADIGGQTCDILSEMHNRDQLHGGLTPGNIFSAQNQIWLAEAGVNQALQAVGAAITQPSGSRQLSYLSPEELSGRRVSAQSEVFSLGVVLYELLTGKLPFGGRTTTMVMATVLTDDSDSSTTTVGAPGSEESDRVVAAILRAIEKDPADRWGSARQFAAALRGEAGTPQQVASNSARGCLPTILLILGAGVLLQHLLS